MEFYDLSKRKRFSTNKYTTKIIKGRKFAIAISPYSKNKCYKIMGSA